MAYGDFKYLARGTASEKVLRDKAFNITKNPTYDGYQRGRVFMVYKFFDEKSASKSSPKNIGSGINMNTNNQQLVKELHKPIIRKFKKKTVYSEFRDNIWVLI